MSEQIQRFAGSTDGLAFHEPVVIVYARELNALEQRVERMKRAAEWWKARAVEEHSEYEVLALDQYPTDDDILAAEALASQEEADLDKLTTQQKPTEEAMEEA